MPKVEVTDEELKWLEGKRAAESWRKVAPKILEREMKEASSWSNFKTKINEYQPENDEEAKSLGFTHKGPNKEGVTTYFLRKVDGAKELK